MTRALETARKDKIIGNSLEAVTRLYASGDTYDLLTSMEKELATVFIVSGVDLSQSKPPEEAFSDEGVPGFGVTVARAQGAKCERCWNYHTEVGNDSLHSTLCPRCAEVVRSM